MAMGTNRSMIMPPRPSMIMRMPKHMTTITTMAIPRHRSTTMTMATMTMTAMTMTIMATDIPMGTTGTRMG
jgi:hypothetical protein